MFGVSRELSRRFTAFPKLGPIIISKRLSSSRIFFYFFLDHSVDEFQASRHSQRQLSLRRSFRLLHHSSHRQVLRRSNRSYKDPKVLDALDAVLDVRGVYDPSRGRYDHHQKGFDEVFGRGFTTKLSSAGLVYKHYGLEMIAKKLHLAEGHPDVHRLYLALYKNFVETVDAIDNGTNQYDTDQPPRYVNNTDLASECQD